MGEAESHGPDLCVLVSVRCLECATVYSKPAGGGTSRANPGCPECGYVGWLPASVPFTAPRESRRFVADRPRAQFARSG